MSKGEITRDVILEKAVELINVNGYAGMSLSDLMEATGLQKGGIYNHFRSKEEIAVEAFDFAFQRTSDLMMTSIKDTREPLDRLRAIIAFFQGYFLAPPFKGGCILLNTTIDSDDSNPALRERARRAMLLWRELIRRTVERGILKGVMKAEIEPDAVATLVIGTLEGSFVLYKLFDDPVHIERAVQHLLAYVDSNIRI